MLQIGCTDIGVLGCDFVARGKKLHKLLPQADQDAADRIAALIEF